MSDVLIALIFWFGVGIIHAFLFSVFAYFSKIDFSWDGFLALLINGPAAWPSILIVIIFCIAESLMEKNQKNKEIDNEIMEEIKEIEIEIPIEDRFEILDI